MHFNMSDKKYITIGTVPLVGMSGQPVPASAPAPSQPANGGQYSPTQPAVLPISPGQPAQPYVSKNYILLPIPDPG